MFPSSDNVTKPYWNKNGSDIIFENVMCKYSGNINVSNIKRKKKILNTDSPANLIYFYNNEL